MKSIPQLGLGRSAPAGLLSPTSAVKLPALFHGRSECGRRSRVQLACLQAHPYHEPETTLVRELCARTRYAWADS